jgi:hypothetical protein
MTRQDSGLDRGDPAMLLTSEDVAKAELTEAGKVLNGVEHIEFTVPTKLNATTDIKISAIGLTGFSGAVTTVLRGWME